MGSAWIILLAIAAVAAVGWLRNRRTAARRRRCRDRLTTVLGQLRPGLSLIETEPGRWRLDQDGRELATVDGKALTGALPADDEPAQRLLLAVADAAAQGPRPLAGDFDLKSHGCRTLPRLADEGLPLLTLEPKAVRHTAADSAGLPTIYLVDGEPQPVYLTDEHLAQTGIDARGLHGVALAVLRQRFDEAGARTALDGGKAVILRPADGCGGSRLLLLPEILRQGESVFAAAPAADRLVIAADRGTLEAALAEIDEPMQPLPPAVFRATTGGLRMES